MGTRASRPAARARRDDRPEVLLSLFEPLGRYITSAIVRAHGGSIAVDSTGGRTRFTVVLPRAASARS